MLKESYKDSVIKKTNNFKKMSGTIVCNRGEQAEETIELLSKHYKNVTHSLAKSGRVAVKYNNDTQASNLTENFTQKKAEELAKDLSFALFQNGRFYDVYVEEDGKVFSIKAIIEWGDEKHDHQYFKLFCKKFFESINTPIVIQTEIIEEDEIGLYSAIHTIKSAGEEVTERLKETHNDNKCEPKVLSKEDDGYDNLEMVARCLNDEFPSIEFAVEERYFDFGKDKKWTTIVLYDDYDTLGTTPDFPVLNKQQWQEIVTPKNYRELKNICNDIIDYLDRVISQKNILYKL